MRRAMIIGTYTRSPVEYLPYDSQSPRVARWIAGVIAESEGSLRVEHIGSTSVPGCWGKGIIDLLVQYKPGGLETARNSLDRMGFQRQAGVEAFPRIASHARGLRAIFRSRLPHSRARRCERLQGGARSYPIPGSPARRPMLEASLRGGKARHSGAGRRQWQRILKCQGRIHTPHFRGRSNGVK